MPRLREAPRRWASLPALLPTAGQGLGAEGRIGEQPESFTTHLTSGRAGRGQAGPELSFPSLAYPEPSVALCQVCIPSRY